MKYYAKLIFELPNTVEETKEILAEYYKDLLWYAEEIEEVVDKIKTWDDVKEFFDTFCYEELMEDLAPYFCWDTERKMTEKG